MARERSLWKDEQEAPLAPPGGDRERARGAPEPKGGSGERWRPTVDRKIKPYECFNGNYFIDRPTGRAHFFHRDRMALGVSVTIRTYIEGMYWDI